MSDSFDFWDGLNDLVTSYTAPAAILSGLFDEIERGAVGQCATIYVDGNPWHAIAYLKDGAGIDAFAPLLEFEGRSSIEVLEDDLEAAVLYLNRIGLESWPGGL